MEGARVICPHCAHLVKTGNFCKRCGEKIQLSDMEKLTEEDVLSDIQYRIVQCLALQNIHDRFLREIFYTMQANRRLNWKVLLLVCSAGGFAGTVACILLAYLFGVILMEVHV